MTRWEDAAMARHRLDLADAMARAEGDHELAARLVTDDLQQHADAGDPWAATTRQRLIADGLQHEIESWYAAHRHELAGLSDGAIAAAYASYVRRRPVHPRGEGQ